MSTHVERCSTDTEPRRHCCRHRLFEGIRSLCGHHSADVVRSRALQHRNGGGNVIRRDQGVTVDPDDNLASRKPDGGIQSRGRGPTRVVHHMHLGELRCERGGNACGVVTTRAHGEDYLEIPLVVLVEYAPHRSTQVPLLVHHGHDDADAR